MSVVPVAVVDPGPYEKSQIDMGNGNWIWPMSVVPVFSPKESFISIIHFYNEKTWNATINQKHYCRFKDGRRTLIEKHGGEEDVTYSKWNVAWKCQADYKDKDEPCHTVQIENE